AERVLGYTAEEAIGKHFSMLIPENEYYDENEIINTIKKGSSIDYLETKRVTKKGNIIDVSLAVSPIKDVLNGTIIGFSKIIRDITERKRTDEELLRSNAELQKANSELDRFVYSASHDLRAPLKSILGLVAITKEIANPQEEELIDCLVMLNNSVLKLDNFIDDILSYSRNSRMEIDKDIIDFEELIGKIRESYQYVEGVKDFDVQVTTCANTVFIGDAKRISVILNNIITNAFKYRDKTKEKSYLKVHFTSKGASIVIRFEDNGIGIADKDKEKIFNMFYRATMLSTGSGLGLYIVKETVDKLGGTINVESELGKGTVFAIEIPNQIAMNQIAMN
ncbi:PAS domain-containing sensor histidine kinase, partial [Flavobacterium sp.]|uniref:sensor histidine kinase n=1 Tax=Flavobacterium sp. TaxID=239 RepID=UPI002C20410D